MTEEFLPAATAIGAELARRALWHGRECNWLAPPERPSGSGEPLQGDVYAGTAGIALFLAFLYRATGDRDIRCCAKGAAEHARRALGTSRPPGKRAFGFYTGRLGVGWMLTRVGPLLGEDRWREEGLERLAALRLEPEENFGLDVISGAAGAIPALLDVHTRTGRPDLLALAQRLGDHLLQTARREAVGWSWDTFPPWVIRNLTGLSHGAAGMGRALAELYALTGDGRYRYGAEQAFLYEDRTFDRTVSNWPDFRLFGPEEYVDIEADPATGHLRASGNVAGLRKAMEAGRISLRPRFMSAWCHGAPGIGLTRLRAYQLLGAARFERGARRALAGLRLPAGQEAAALSLCHGLGGRLELPLVAGEVLGEMRYRRRAEAAVRKILSRGLDLQKEDMEPGLMLGWAGIGYFLLRLCDPSGVPSILLPGPASPAEDKNPGTTRGRVELRPGGGRGGAEGLRDEYVREYFGETLSLLPQTVRPSATDFKWGRPDVELAYRAIRRAVGRLRGQAGRSTSPVFARERQRFLAARQPSLEGPLLLETLLRPSSSALDWDGARFQIHPAVRLLSVLGKRFALRPHRGRLLDVALSETEWQVLHGLRRPRCLARLCRALVGTSVSSQEARKLTSSIAVVKAVLERAYRLGIVRVVTQA
ncbi:MAG: hypothetical protein HOP28_00005 [Gemmatimonadales bacterium]|nr:hypothetical protein [Gemmatimonadales bacterium]